jgi:hypothetical protein
VEGQRGSRVGPYQAAVLLMSYEYICTSAGCTAGDSVVKTVAWCVWCTRPAAGQVLQRYDSQGTAHSAQAHRHTGLAASSTPAAVAPTMARVRHLLVALALDAQHAAH